MLPRRALLLTGVLAASALRANAQRIDCRDALDNLERFTGKDDRNVKPVARLERAVRYLLKNYVYIMDGMLTAHGGPESAALVNAALAQMRRPDLQELRVQCTLVTMPAKTAADCGLVSGTTKTVDGGEASKVLKAALAAHGTMRNLPEAGGLPLQPFVLEQANDERRVRMEALPVEADEALFMFQLAAGRLPVDRTLFPDRKLIETSVRLKVGSGAMATAIQEDLATVAWVRFIGTRAAEPHKDEDGKDQGKDQGRGEGK